MYILCAFVMQKGKEAFAVKSLFHEKIYITKIEIFNKVYYISFYKYTSVCDYFCFFSSRFLNRVGAERFIERYKLIL